MIAHDITRRINAWMFHKSWGSHTIAKSVWEENEYDYQDIEPIIMEWVARDLERGKLVVGFLGRHISNHDDFFIVPIDWMQYIAGELNDFGHYKIRLSKVRKNCDKWGRETAYLFDRLSHEAENRPETGFYGPTRRSIDDGISPLVFWAPGERKRVFVESEYWDGPEVTPMTKDERKEV